MFIVSYRTQKHTLEVKFRASFILQQMYVYVYISRLCLSRYSLSLVSLTLVLLCSFHASVTFTTDVTSYIKYRSNFFLAHIMMELLSFFNRIHILHVYYILTAAVPRAKLVLDAVEWGCAFSEHQGKYILSYEI